LPRRWKCLNNKLTPLSLRGEAEAISRGIGEIYGRN
jgi:hypothetical protein